MLVNQMQCCGWTDRQDWSGNMVIVNSSGLLFPCSCQNVSATTGNFSDSGFCEAQTPDWPVYDVVSCCISLCANTTSVHLALVMTTLLLVLVIQIDTHVTCSHHLSFFYPKEALVNFFWGGYLENKL